MTSRAKQQKQRPETVDLLGQRHQQIKIFYELEDFFHSPINTPKQKYPNTKKVKPLKIQKFIQYDQMQIISENVRLI